MKLYHDQLIISVLDEEELPEPMQEDQENLEELEMTEITDSTQEVVDAAARELGGNSGRIQVAFSPGRTELHISKEKRADTKANDQVRPNS